MKTCFLFAEKLEDDKVLSVCFDDESKLTAACEIRSFEAIQALQRNARTIVVLPTRQCSLHVVSLPKLSTQKARAAIPYALEEHLAQDVATLHFAFDSNHRENQQSLVVVIDEAFLSQRLQQFETNGIRVDEVTIDWFALEKNQVCVKGEDAFVRSSAFSGALSFKQVESMILTPSFDGTLFTFDNPKASTNAQQTISFEQWVASRLLDRAFIDLCQGRFERGKKSQSLKFWYGLSAALVAIWFLVFIGVNLVKVSVLNHKMKEVDQQIAIIYRKFFPQAKQVISPKFRISRLLKDQGADAQDNLWFLIATLGKHLKTGQWTIEKIAYQKALFRVTLRCESFSALEQLEQKLKQDGIQVRQLSAANEQSQVLATIELSI